MNEPGGSLRVNGVVVDLVAETLRDRDGRPVELRPRAFAVLRHLVENPGRLVTKNELIAAVWPGLAVTDDSLVQCIHEIRRALGDEARSVLKTVPRRGYKLASPDAGADPAATGSLPLVAVLPFQALSDDESARLLAKGLTEDAITDLTRMPEFEVLTSGATEGYRGADPRTAGVALKAAFVVRGSIARDGDRVRVTAQLVDAATGSSLWSDRWDRPADDFFAVQAEIAERIANRLGGGAGIVQEAGRNAARRKPPASLSAYELYLLGTEKQEKVNRVDVLEAVKLLERAVEIDPGFARAWIGLHDCYGNLVTFGVDPAGNRERAEAAAQRALALDPGDPEAHAAMGWRLGLRGDIARARAEFETALQLAPNAAEILTYLCSWLSAFGEPERGAALVDRLVRLEPNFPMRRARHFSYAYFQAGRYEDVLAMIDRLAPETWWPQTYAFHAGSLAALGRLEEARAASAKAAAARPDVTIESLINAPRYSEAERRRFIDTLRPAGFPACAAPEALARIDNPRRLPECLARAGAGDP
jgi:TolB-like protein